MTHRLILILSFASLVFFSTTGSATALSSVKKGQPIPADRFIELAKLVNPAVVNISTTAATRNFRRHRGGQRDPFFDLFEQFMNPYYGQPNQPQQQAPQSLGTGFIIRKDGLIITNNHVIQNADIIKVQLSGQSKKFYEAKVIGRDQKTDIALIKIDAGKALPILEMGESQKLQVGEWVAAFGNPYGHGHTMTKGIISAIGREIDELNLFPFLQTDASINPGNSGGPLLNLRGQVIGVNTAIDARAQGIGFAIPIDNVKSLLPELERKGSIDRGFIGVYMTNVDNMIQRELGLKQKDGALVTQVFDKSPASRAGLKPYDLIIELKGKSVDNTSDLAKIVSTTPINKKVKVKIIRNNKKKTLHLTIGRHPSSQPVAGNSKKIYKGQKAPFELGFKVTNYSASILEEYGTPELRSPHPIVIDVSRGSKASRAGLAPGDVILDVNRKPVKTAKDVLKRLKKGANMLRVLKRDRVVLLHFS